MVNQNMAVDKELVHGIPHTIDFDIDADFANSAGLVNDELRADVFGGEDLGGFSSIEDLEDFLRTFEAGSEDEASLATQGDDDVGGEPLTTVH